MHEPDVEGLDEVQSYLYTIVSEAIANEERLIIPADILPRRMGKTLVLRRIVEETNHALYLNTTGLWDITTERQSRISSRSSALTGSSTRGRRIGGRNPYYIMDEFVTDVDIDRSPIAFERYCAIVSMQGLMNIDAIMEDERIIRLQGIINRYNGGTEHVLH